MELGRQLTKEDLVPWSIYHELSRDAGTKAHMHAMNEGFRDLDNLRESIVIMLVTYGRFNSLWN